MGQRTALNLRQCTLAQLAERLRDLFPPELLDSPDEGPGSRNRVFCLRLTFECFVWQMLKPQTACREVVRHVQTLFRMEGRGRVDEGDSAYIQARQRLPRQRMEEILRATAQTADRRAGQAGHINGRPVKVVDGSSTQLPDTPANQKHYPQPKEQKRGCGFPVMKFVVLFSLASGAILERLTGNLHQSDLRLFQQLWESLKPGDVLLGDRAFGEYATLAGLLDRSIDVLARLHQRRRVDFRKGKRLGKHDALFGWSKSQNKQLPISNRRSNSHRTTRTRGTDSAGRSSIPENRRLFSIREH